MIQKKFGVLILIILLIVGALLFFGMPGSLNRDAVKVSLNEARGIPQVREIDGIGFSEPDANTLRVAIAGVLSPTKALEYYQELLTYMERKLNKRVILILKPTYAEINDLIKGGRVDVAFVCTLSYVKGNEEFGLELLVAPQMYGGTIYYSYLIVPGDSSATSLKDLRGGSFAFSDPMSNTGFLAPSYQLSLTGEIPTSFFRRHIFTYSHDNSIAAVAGKIVDGAAVDSLVFDQLVANNAELASKVKIIDRWGPYGMPPVVVSPNLDITLKQKLQAFFLELHTSTEGMAILKNLQIDKFVVISDDTYDSVREMVKRVEAAK